MEPMLRNPLCSIQIRSRRGLSMPEKKKTAAAAPAVEAGVRPAAVPLRPQRGPWPEPGLPGPPEILSKKETAFCSP